MWTWLIPEPPAGLAVSAAHVATHQGSESTVPGITSSLHHSSKYCTHTCNYKMVYLPHPHTHTAPSHTTLLTHHTSPSHPHCTFTHLHTLHSSHTTLHPHTHTAPSHTTLLTHHTSPSHPHCTFTHHTSPSHPHASPPLPRRCAPCPHCPHRPGGGRWGTSAPWTDTRPATHSGWAPGGGGRGQRGREERGGGEEGEGRGEGGREGGRGQHVHQNTNCQ